MAVIATHGYVNLNDLLYDLASAMDLAQGLSNLELLDSSMFNPGADVDHGTTTDFEDLAGPVADVSEFADQDRALLTDSWASTAF